MNYQLLSQHSQCAGETHVSEYVAITMGLPIAAGNDGKKKDSFVKQEIAARNL